MKGIILAGGAGTRLYPLTSLYNKQLLPIHDKPMIYYPLSTLILMGINEILIISSPEQVPNYKFLFRDIEKLGVHLEYKVQDAPNGLAEAFILGAEFVGADGVTLILGDNIFYGKLDLFRNALEAHGEGAHIFGYYVNDPERYGVVDFDEGGNALSIEEKPAKPKSNYAVPGLYIYDNSVLEVAANIKPSARGELEITDVNRYYLEKNKLKVTRLGRGVAWLDTGTPSSMLEAANFIASLEHRQGLKIGSIEEAALFSGFIDRDGLKKVIASYPKCDYRTYLERILEDF
jgi:glucose-1-phosphate thymidylyltransferase